MITAACTAKTGGGAAGMRSSMCVQGHRSWRLRSECVAQKLPCVVFGGTRGIRAVCHTDQGCVPQGSGLRALGIRAAKDLG